MEIQMKLQYIKAGSEDLDILIKTRVEVLRAANKLDETADMSVVERESRRYYETSLKDQSHVAYLVYDGDTCVGTGGVSFFKVMPTFHNPSGEKAYIMNIYTSPQYRRRGIAYHTLDLLVKEAKERGVSHITLEATEMGRALYEKYGFTAMKDEMELNK